MNRRHFWRTLVGGAGVGATAAIPASPRYGVVPQDVICPVCGVVQPFPDRASSLTNWAEELVTLRRIRCEHCDTPMYAVFGRPADRLLIPLDRP